MADFIILTAQEADAVRGPTDHGAALDPVLREGDAYILGVEVLGDPAHAAHHDFLAALPVLGLDDPDFPPAIPFDPATSAPVRRGRGRKS